MNVNIEFKDKILSWKLYGFTPVSTIGVGAAIASKTSIDELTKEKAIPILKKIILKSTLLSIATKPIFLISVGTALILAGFGATVVTCLFPPAIPFLFISIPVAVIGGSILNTGLEGALKDSFKNISRSYKEQKRQALEHLETLNNLPEDTIVTFSIKSGPNYPDFED